MPAACALTGTADSKFVKAHLYPKACYPRDDKTEPMALIGTRIEERPKRSWEGLYDSNILSQDGETILSAIDSRGLEILKPNESASKLSERADQVLGNKLNPIGMVLSQERTEPVLLFIASVLWRFHVSQMQGATNVNLGRYAEDFRQAILKNSIEPISFFEVLINKLTDTVGGIVITPARFKDKDGANLYEMIFGGYRYWAKVDSGRQFEAPIRTIATRRGGKVIVICRDYQSSKSYKKFTTAAKRQVAAHGLPWNNAIKQKYGLN